MRALERKLEREFRAVPDAVPLARKALEAIGAEVPGDVMNDVRLLVSELITNSIRHSGLLERHQIGLAVDVGEGMLHVEVSDRGGGFEPGLRALSPDQNSGWGLHLVDRIASRWGVKRDGATCVWFEIEHGRRPTGN